MTEKEKDRQETVEMLETIANALVEALERYKKNPTDEEFEKLLEVERDIFEDQSNPLPLDPV